MLIILLIKILKYSFDSLIKNSLVVIFYTTKFIKLKTVLCRPLPKLFLFLSILIMIFLDLY